MGCGCQIDNQSNLDTTQLSPLIDDLAGHVQKTMGIKSLPAITLKDDEANSANPLGKTAYYDPGNKVITIFVTGRHPKDVMRSIAHELIHHSQNERGMFKDIGAVGEQGYAQKDPHLRKMEKEAYLKGNMCFRDWEDGYKNAVMESIYDKQQILRRKTMEIHDWKNKELQKLLMEKFGFGEGKPADDELSKKREVVMEEAEEAEESESEESGGEEEASSDDGGGESKDLSKLPPGLRKHMEKKKAKGGKEKQEESIQKPLAEDETFRQEIRAIFEQLTTLGE